MGRHARTQASGFAAAFACAAIALAATQNAVAGGLIYVNRCAAGCTVTPGTTDDAINGTSTIIGATKSLSAFAYGDAVLSDTVVCLRSLFARYDVDIVSANPGGVARREVMLAGTGTELGYPGIPGIAPLTGSPIDNAIAFTFANDIGPDPDKLCWIAAAQLGALYGLEAEYHCPDATTYLTGCGVKTFADFDAPCGTSSAQATCSLTTGQPTQNSAVLLALTAGLSDRIFLNEFEQPRPAP